MAPPPNENDADAIRLRRLARLGQPQQQQHTNDAGKAEAAASSSSSSTLATDSTVASGGPPSTNREPIMTTSEPVQGQQRQVNTARPATNASIKSQSTSPVIKHSPRQDPSSTTPLRSTSSSAAIQAPAEQPLSLHFTDSFEQWQNAALGRILNVTLKASAASCTSPKLGRPADRLYESDPDREQAEQLQWAVTFLKEVAEEVAQEDPGGLDRPFVAGAIVAALVDSGRRGRSRAGDRARDTAR
ncbi:Ubiquitin conjugation factor E4 [Microbotryomycetes sp. JL221]|nr:Ubiquitin conjugation factor E4 [Microbotryomycetes sp. JL221]